MSGFFAVPVAEWLERPPVHTFEPKELEDYYRSCHALLLSSSGTDPQQGEGKPATSDGGAGALIETRVRYLPPHAIDPLRLGEILSASGALAAAKCLGAHRLKPQVDIESSGESDGEDGDVCEIPTGVSASGSSDACCDSDGSAGTQRGKRGARTTTQRRRKKRAISSSGRRDGRDAGVESGPAYDEDTAGGVGDAATNPKAADAAAVENSNGKPGANSPQAPTRKIVDVRGLAVEEEPPVPKGGMHPIIVVDSRMSGEVGVRNSEIVVNMLNEAYVRFREERRREGWD